MPISSPDYRTPPVEPTTLWLRTFDVKLRAAVGESLRVQRSVIHQIVTAEPRLSEAVIAARFAEAILKRASLLSLDRRESAICQVLELVPSLNRDEVIEKLNRLAIANLPAWTSSSFWSQNIDPILLVAIRNASQELDAAIRQIRSVHPNLTVSELCERYRWHRSKQTSTSSKTVSDWPSEADRLLRDAFAVEIEAERNAIRRASKKYPELRVKAIEERFKTLKRRSPTNCEQRYQRLAWSLETDARLWAAAETDSFQTTVANIAAEFGRSRECVYWHCEQRLGIPRQKRDGPKRQGPKLWDAADTRYLLDYMNEKDPRRIASALKRSYWSVVKKTRALGGGTIVPRYSLRDLRRDLHLSQPRLARLTQEGKLKVAITKRQLRRGQQQYILEEDLLYFLEQHSDELDLTRVEATAKIRVLVDEALTKKGQASG